MCKGVCYLSLSCVIKLLLQNCETHAGRGQFAQKGSLAACDAELILLQARARTSLLADCVWKEKTKRRPNLQTATCTLGTRRFAGAENCCERSRLFSNYLLKRSVWLCFLHCNTTKISVIGMVIFFLRHLSTITITNYQICVLPIYIILGAVIFRKMNHLEKLALKIYWKSFPYCNELVIQYQLVLRRTKG